MVAVDTNVLVRLLVADDPNQTAAARVLFAQERIWIAKTALLETAWVLRSSYRFKEDEIREALVRLLGLKNVEVEDEPAITLALDLGRHGVEFADALHLSSRPSGSSFVSFDRDLVRRAVRADAVGIRELQVPPD